jgi:hypothetical protein
MTGTGFAAAAPRAAFLLPKRTLFLLALFLSVFMPAAAGLMWQPYTGKGPPGTYRDPVFVKDQTRHPLGDPLPVRRVPTTSYRFDPHVQNVKKRGKRDPRCNGPARYEAMREAYEAGRPQPC